MVFQPFEDETKNHHSHINDYSGSDYRFAPIEEDLLLYPKTYIDGIQLKEKVNEAKAELEKLKK